MTNEIRFYPLTRRKMIDHIRDIRRTLGKVIVEVVDHGATPRTMDLLGLAIISCVRARRDLDDIRPKKREKAQ